jgi:hypothetical protein
MANTKTRGVRIPDREWLPAQASADKRGRTMADIIRDAVRQEAAKHTFRAWVQLEGRYWIIRIPIIDGITQARTKREIELMAKDLVAVTLDIPTAEAKVEILEGVPE